MGKFGNRCPREVDGRLPRVACMGGRGRPDSRPRVRHLDPSLSAGKVGREDAAPPVCFPRGAGAGPLCAFPQVRGHALRCGPVGPRAGDVRPDLDAHARASLPLAGLRGADAPRGRATSGRGGSFPRAVAATGRRRSHRRSARPAAPSSRTPPRYVDHSGVPSGEIFTTKASPSPPQVVS